MRTVRATPADCYQVHKTYNEFRKDIGMNGLEPKDISKWLPILANDDYDYRFLMHGKKILGMVWGHKDPHGYFVIEGKFLRRAWRGKWRFSKGLYRAYVDIVKNFDTIKEINIKPKGNVVGYLTQKKARRS